MSTGKTLVIESGSSGATRNVGEHLGKALRGGEVFELRSDIGGGKTTFIRGLAIGAGSRNAAGSPSFTLERVYQTPQFRLHHFDFYRLPAGDKIVGQELAEALAEPKAVIAVEWAKYLAGSLPKRRIVLSIEVTGEEARRLRFSYPSEYDYLFRKVAHA
jgi:tRNA threonylcarbamoyladenosine biosynthesis protein TsaE